MAVDIKIPTVGESVHEGTISRWIKKDGDLVEQDEPILELETDKATEEMPAPARGRLRIAVAESSKRAQGERACCCDRGDRGTGFRCVRLRLPL